MDKIVKIFDMKKEIIVMALAMSLGVFQQSLASSAPKHRYTPSTQQVDKKVGNHSENDEGIDAFSDTTSVDTSSAVSAHNNPASYTSNNPSQFSLDNYDDPFDFLGTVFGKGVLLFVIILLGLIGLLTFLAPLIALFMIIRYLYRRNQDRMKLSAMALEKGIEIPESARPIDKQSNEYLVKRGLRNAFLGAGLCAMFAIWGADFLAGIGALVLFYGAGQATIGSLPSIKQWWCNRKSGKIG